MQALSFSRPVGEMMRPTIVIDARDSLEVAARKLRDNGSPVAPVVADERLIGLITERCLMLAAGSGESLDTAAEVVMESAQSIPPFATAAQALRQMESTGAEALVVADSSNQVVGLIFPSDFYPKRPPPIRPPMIGGMATPFGVYLTTGVVSAGSSHVGLVLTGMSLFLMFLGSSIGGILAADALHGAGYRGQILVATENLLPLVLFLATMRLIPLSGIHAAEHKVVHAIERGEELTRETVRRMPRDHPRCGTNLAVGVSIFVSLATWNAISQPEFRVLLAAIVTMLTWRRLGSIVQLYITTRPPTDRQIDMGIQSGKELLARCRVAPSNSPGFFGRVLHSGMLHVITGSLLAYGFAWAIGRAVGFELL